MPGVSIVIPTYGNWWLTERCLAALDRHGVPDQEIVVVDDGSRDETRARLAETRGIEVVFAARNRGFASACNTGAAVARAEILLFLNADTEVLPGAIAALVAALDDPTVGIAGAKLLYPDGGIQHAGLFIDGPKFGHAHWFRPADLPDADLARDYPVVTGAALAVRAADFRALGGFDAGYLNGYEDADLCLSVWSAGKRVRYEPAATILHVESASEGRFDHDEQNYRRFMSRWQDALTQIPAMPRRPRTVINLVTALDAAGEAADLARRFAEQLGIAAPAERRRFDADGGAFAALIRYFEHAIALVAPRDAAEARSVCAAIPADRYWAPTMRGVAALREAGIALDRADLWRPGIATRPPAADARNVVAYVTSGTTAAALRTALDVFAAAGPRLNERGLRGELRSPLPEAAFAALLQQAAGEGAVPEVVVTFTTGDPTGDDVLDGAHTLLVTGPTDRAGRIALLAFANGVDVVAAAGAEPELAYLVSSDAFVEAPVAGLAEALLAAIDGERNARLAAARRDVDRRHGIAKARIRTTVLIESATPAYDVLAQYALDDAARSAFATRQPR